MPIKYDLKPGTLLLCDYGDTGRAAEMVKRRPVVIVSPRLRHRQGLATVVPLSTTAPAGPQAYHLALNVEPPLPSPFDAADVWVKADMIATVSFERLDLFRTARDQYGKRKYLQPRLSADQLAALRRCVAHALGLIDEGS
ncbi:MAG: type II toxin-antitoxin system PemK/MazF family toxin [Phenylobacterium sp.]|uniref:type II toxin-antitoxin system PemK/MazF family toxin n=1 Tax=Phenylobacterium sp. TaxID=1871053 RepID=UPI002715FA96|nr:type II toxin-antitoxin system PemK/MazF family toxin [Phenylobacterium sp.]MDO8409361.1 type II toxin-antitoxin system PemK/MazF family toxin [Phenylobacterium sp.]